MKNKEITHKISVLLGKKNIKKKPEIELPPYVPKSYPIRSRALGKNTTSEQGVGGWRTQYHRPSEKITPDDYRFKLKYNH
jgi:hypothetical protein